MRGGPAAAEESQSAWSHQIVYKADVMGAVSGGLERRGQVLDNLDLVLDGDLEKAIGWRGATVHAYVLNNSGGRPNDVAGALQGVDNIEVAHARTRLFELWVEQAVPGSSVTVRAGLYDLNSEFYSTEASHLLLAPPFGIGSEFSGTGPNGPSIFPLSALALRIRAGGETGGYAQAAVVSAHAGALSQPEHLDMGLDRGAILIGEAGVRGAAHVAVGAWTYTEKQDDIRDVTSTGEPVQRQARGAYALAERELWAGAGGAKAAAFARIGVSDGRTTPFRAGWQAGLRFDGVVPSRPKSAASIGLQQAFISGRLRESARESGGDMAPSESGVEITYADSFGRLSVQPDLQLIRHPGGRPDDKPAVVAGVRFTIDLS